MEHSENLDKLATALSKAQGDIENAAKTSQGNFGKFADLAACWNAVRVPLTSNGLSVVQSPSTDENGAVVITTMLLHASGQWMRDSMACRPAKPDAQALGSVTTYLRRYGLAAITGLAQVDDDGEAAVGRGANGATTKMDLAKKTTVKRGVKNGKNAEPRLIPVQFSDNGSDWKAWATRYEKSIAYAPDLKWLNEQVALNEIPMRNFTAHDADGGKATQDITATRVAFFAGEPLDKKAI